VSLVINQIVIILKDKPMTVIVKMSLVAFFFAFTGAIPIVGPSVSAYILAYDKHFNQTWALSQSRLLAAMFLGVLFFTFLFELNSWPLPTTVAVCSLNILFTIVFFFIGVSKRTLSNKRNVSATN
jgi:hypothetical protein